ncbi:hypothetical protein EVAR_98982_1 [Eumeta japonica]|uniref:Uncharacterized protein n=1 Tax=Eumeta variegata TaxID=151549 RepID=A0A4C1YS96_EUMVA|nr:hypothetical protein EVAR_98982_1 [Eumeta japonica]
MAQSKAKLSEDEGPYAMKSVSVLSDAIQQRKEAVAIFKAHQTVGCVESIDKGVYKTASGDVTSGGPIAIGLGARDNAARRPPARAGRTATRPPADARRLCRVHVPTNVVKSITMCLTRVNLLFTGSAKARRYANVQQLRILCITLQPLTSFRVQLHLKRCLCTRRRAGAGGGRKKTSPGGRRAAIARVRRAIAHPPPAARPPPRR